MKILNSKCIVPERRRGACIIRHENLKSIEGRLYKMKKVVYTKQAPQTIGPYSQAIVANGFLFVSGQIPVNPANGEISTDIKKQTEQSLANVKAILAAEGSTTADVVKTTIFIKNINDFTLIGGASIC